MNEFVGNAKKVLAEKIIEKMKLRQFEACYCATKEEAFDKVVSYFTPGCSVTCGGSTTLAEMGLKDYLTGEGAEKLNYINRDLAKTAEEKREVFAKQALADYFLMSTNAMTVDGELVNIDGVGNRVAALCFGPENVIIVASMNKVCQDVDAAIWRTRNIASPPNNMRLNTGTPCTKLGRCGDCLTPGCICADIVITRFSRTPGRIKVVLVGEDLGF